MVEIEENRINGAEALVRSLLAEGVDTVFGYPGGAIMPVYDRLYFHTDRLRHILVRHEQGATHAAQGYARATGRTATVIVTSGPGATNIITGLSDALMDSTPMVVITGQVASAFLGSDAFQETDVLAIVQPVTKWAVQIRRPEDIPAAVAKAYYIAGNGRPGPVVIDIAKDAQTGMLDWTGYTPCRHIRSYSPKPAINEADIKRAASMINSASRPIIVAGHGVAIANAENLLIQIAEKGDIPVAATLLGLSCMPSAHPLFKGMVGMHGNLAPNINTNRADLIVAVGMRFDDRVTSSIEAYAPQAEKIHIDIDAAEFNKNVRVDLAVHADAADALSTLLPLINQNKRTAWNGSFAPHREVETQKVILPETAPADGPMKMGEVISQVAEAFDRRAIGVTDVGQNQMFGARYFTYNLPKSFITSGGLGTMGFGLPAAIGAKIGAPARQVVLFTGDGGLQMTVQELGTIMEYGIDIKIVLLNNNYLGNVRQWQELFFDGRYSCTAMTNPDFVRLASAYGIAGENVDTRSELPAAIERMKNHPGAYLLNVAIDPTDMIFPMIPLGAPVDTMMLSKNEIYKP